MRCGNIDIFLQLKKSGVSLVSKQDNKGTGQSGVLCPVLLEGLVGFQKKRIILPLLFTYDTSEWANDPNVKQLCLKVFMGLLFDEWLSIDDFSVLW